jgi:uncharacterized repeat protein (TIGR03803 family)
MGISYYGRATLGIVLAGAILEGCGGGQSAIGVPLSSSAAQFAPHRTPQSVSYELLYSFHHRTFPKTQQNDGRHPNAGLINVGGAFFGTTYYGGTDGCRVVRGQIPGCGTVFTITPSGAENVLYRFGGPPNDGAAPDASLLDAGGTLYGTTKGGGTSRNGTVFTITSSGTETLLHDFAGEPTDGAHPSAALIDVDGTLYGTTDGGGSENLGTVFSFATSGTVTVLHSFAGKPNDGAGSVSALLDVDGTLYGTTVSGGANNDGTVFSITPSGTEKVLYSFKGGPTDGTWPSGALIEVHGTLFGVTQGGGTKGFGTVYSITPSGSEKVLYSSVNKRRDGAGPGDALTYVHGTFYGVTSSGGMGRFGTAFSLTESGTHSVLHDFSGDPDGGSPAGTLLYVNGALYGTTWKGGAAQEGTVFALTL